MVEPSLGATRVRSRSFGVEISPSANNLTSYQIADSVAGFAYAFGGTCIILFIMNLIPGLSLRATEEAEVLGIDDAELGEFAVCISWNAFFMGL